MHIFYVDDSGDESLTTFSAVGVPVQCWSAALGAWLAWRRHLRDVHGVSVLYRLHATDWVAGRGRPSQDLDGEINRSKPLRWREYLGALEALASTTELRVLTVCRPGSDRAATYRILMRWIDELLAAENDHGLLIVDGDGAELRTMHRELDITSRAIVEDPWKRDARESQWIQAADFVAYAAFHHVVCKRDRAFMWQWYEQCLGDRIVRDPAARLGMRGLEPLSEERRRAAPGRPF